MKLRVCLLIKETGPSVIYIRVVQKCPKIMFVIALAGGIGGNLGRRFQVRSSWGALDTGQGSAIEVGHPMLCEVGRLMAGALPEHMKLGPWPLRDPWVHLSRPKAPFDWFAYACTAGAPKFSDALAPHSLTLTEPALPLPPFPRHLARSRFTLHHPPPTERSSTQHGESCCFSPASRRSRAHRRCLPAPFVCFRHSQFPLDFNCRCEAFR